MQPEEFQKAWNVSRESFSKLRIYHDLLLKWQRAVNLVAPSTLDEVWMRHFADSAQLGAYIKQNAVVVDLGSGAGFPGLVLAMLRPDLEIHLIESDGKKVQFLKNVSRETERVVSIHHGRVENILPGLKPDVVTARAFASLQDIISYCFAAGKSTAQLVLPKGQGVQAEIAAAEKEFIFDCERQPSLTDKGASILLLGNFKKR